MFNPLPPIPGTQSGILSFVKSSNKDVKPVNNPVYRHLRGVFDTLKYVREYLYYRVPGSAPVIP